MSTSKRPSPATAKPPTSISPTAVVADTASLTGTHRITIGHNTVVHPRAKIISTHGPVTIKDGCIVCERSVVGLLASGAAEDDGGDHPAEGVVIDERVLVEIGAQVEAARVGSGTILGVNARVGRGVVLGQHCKVGALCEVDAHEVVPDHTVIYGTGQRRLTWPRPDGVKGTGKRHAEALRRLIPSNPAKWQSS